VENAATEPCFFDSILENFTIIAEENNRSLIAKSNIQQTIYTDKILLKQVMTILFDNAIKYTDQEGKIQMNLDIRDRHLIFTVADDGLGIS
ncbi:ATP-binding protein, partial [Streptococcus pyogenes]